MDFCSDTVKLLSSSFSRSTTFRDCAVPSRSLQADTKDVKNRRRPAYLEPPEHSQLDLLLLRLQLQHHLLKLHLLLLQDLVETLQLLQTQTRPLMTFYFR